VDDGLVCTLDRCVADAPIHEPALAGTPCAQAGGTECNGVGQCVPVGCGDGNLDPGEACDDGNWIDGDGCDSNCTVTACGNGVTALAEACDDGNAGDGDGCDSNCTLTGCGNEIVTEGETCDDGNAYDGDGCDTNCTPSACGNGVAAGAETCDDGNLVDGDGCDSNCTPTVCGNGVVTAGEGCDDGNVAPDDGCSDACQPEPGYDCGGSPSVCTSQEWNCGDHVDNDGDGKTDLGDEDCQLPGFVGCGAGETLLVHAAAASQLPVGIPDAQWTPQGDVPGTVAVTAELPGSKTITRVATMFRIAHPYDSDLVIRLTPPTGGELDLSSGNGGNGYGYTDTLLDDGCATVVSAGTAPFTGCYRPEASFSSLAGSQVAGAWTLRIADTSVGDYIGAELQSWKLIFCATP
jgi:cysteine-rich repeat protein